MTRELIFKNLPFAPVCGQVIYVEQSHHEQLNKFIRNNYDWLKRTFRSQSLEFCYLPLLADEALSYNAPYLSRQERQARVSEVPSLAQYLAADTLEVPALVFALDEAKDDEGNTILLAVDIEKKWYASTKLAFAGLAKTIGKIYDCQRGDNVKLVWDLLDEASKSHEEPEDGAKRGYEIREEDTSSAVAEPDSPRFSQSGSMDAESRPDHHAPYDSNIRFSAERGLSGADNPQQKSNECEATTLGSGDDSGILYRMGDDDRDDAYSNFNAADRILLKEFLQNVYALRCHGVSTMFLHGMIDKNERLSRMLITKDLRIFLPDYDNMEIKMPALCKTVFFFFLRHPEGIRFKDLPEHYPELLQIYLEMHPKGGRAKQEQSISDIVDPCSNSINEKCARIRAAFVANFDDRLARNYYVTGKSGEAKRILLDESLIIWE